MFLKTEGHDTRIYELEVTSSRGLLVSSPSSSELGGDRGGNRDLFALHPLCCPAHTASCVTQNTEKQKIRYWGKRKRAVLRLREKRKSQKSDLVFAWFVYGMNWGARTVKHVRAKLRGAPFIMFGPWKEQGGATYCKDTANPASSTGLNLSGGKKFKEACSKFLIIINPMSRGERGRLKS